MQPGFGLVLLSIALILGNAFFVAAEYALVGARRARIESLAKKGNRTAKILFEAMQNLGPYVAGLQIGITAINIATGSVTEPFITGMLQTALGLAVPKAFSAFVSVLLVTYLMVVVGELMPKYLTLQMAEKVALAVIRPLKLIVTLMTPLVWVVQASGTLLLRPFGVDISKEYSEAIPREELMTLVRAGGAEGTLDKAHADMVTRALRLDQLDARDIMVHRLDMKWIDAGLDRNELLARMREIPYSRLPVCRGDIDDMVGIVYVHDVVRTMDDPDFQLANIVRPVVVIPESLTLERILNTMREEKTQMLVVMDEYGGTSGLVTLEDVVEEVFGELEDRLESERPPIDVLPSGRISARADVRYDELVARLGLDVEPDTTDTLAQMVIDGLERIPRPGDSVETKLGLMRVENMARRRITRVGIVLSPDIAASRRSPQ